MRHDRARTARPATAGIRRLPSPADAGAALPRPGSAEPSTIDRIADLYPPRIDIDLDDLADMASAIVDGGITLSKTLREPRLLSRQVMLYRAFIRAVFLGA